MWKLKYYEDNKRNIIQQTNKDNSFILNKSY